MQYMLMQPPFEVKEFMDMNKKEAQAHFEWYIKEIPSRLEMLREAYQVTGGGSRDKLDFSPNSLVEIWRWFILNVEIEQKTDEEIINETKNYPEWISKNISKQRISVGWMAIAMDIAIYFAECFTNNYSQIKWGVVTKPKGLAYLNKPVLTGFKTKIELDAMGVVNNLTFKVTSGEKSINALLELYNTWISWI